MNVNADRENLLRFARALWQANKNTPLPPLEQVTGIEVHGQVGGLVQINISVIGLRLPDAVAEDSEDG